MKASDLCDQASKDAGVLGVGEVLGGDVAADVLILLNRLLDSWNADGRYCYAERFDQFTITPSLNPHTLGPTGTFSYTPRPNSIEAGNVIDTAVSPNIKIPLKLVDYQWYVAQSSPNTTTTIAVAAYYQPDWPLGKLFLWPVPTLAYKIELWTTTTLTQLALTDTFTLPPGYQEAISLTLAESVARIYAQGVSPELKQEAQNARRRLWEPNLEIPRIATRDAGMPAGGNRPSFNYLTGLN